MIMAVSRKKLKATQSPRIAIESVSPSVDAGRFAAKAIVGKPITVSAVIFVDGHDKLQTRLLWRAVRQKQWSVSTFRSLGNDHWETDIQCDTVGRLEFMVEAWIDHYLGLCDEIEKKFAAGVDISLELQEGEALLEDVLSGDIADENARAGVEQLLSRLRAASSDEDRMIMLLASDSVSAVSRAESRPHRVLSDCFTIEVERQAAEFASWYELFPRSMTDDVTRHGTFADVRRQLPHIRAMGFDVLYFPPIHPIGHTHRKGRNNALTAEPDDPGSPYAIGSEAGGHEAIHPELGSLADFLQLVQDAHEHGLEIALDFAIQCSPDHPWLQQHPEWFRWRPDGSVRYAENPPKKYEDIVNVDFYAERALPDLWLALRDIVMTWVERGVKMFRVDNPHTKPLPFWEWMIADIRRQHPDVIFLAEAFTRPAMMARLGKVGFSQSYTYFTWRNTRDELAQYFTELNGPPWRDCYRPHFFVNTPDINPFVLHNAGRAGFLIRAALATMGSGLWGLYSGFEWCESAPVPGKEEYLDSEKYQIRARLAPEPTHDNIVYEISQLNRIRRNNPALQTHLGLQVYQVANGNILLFGKRTADLSNFILIAVSVDPDNAQESHFELPLWEFGLPDSASMDGEDLMNGHRWTWHGKHQWMRIEPWHLPFGIWKLSVPDVYRQQEVYRQQGDAGHD